MRQRLLVLVALSWMAIAGPLRANQLSEIEGSQSVTFRFGEVSSHFLLTMYLGFEGYSHVFFHPSIQNRFVGIDSTVKSDELRRQISDALDIKLYHDGEFAFVLPSDVEISSYHTLKKLSNWIPDSDSAKEKYSKKSYQTQSPESDNIHAKELKKVLSKKEWAYKYLECNSTFCFAYRSKPDDLTEPKLKPLPKCDSSFCFSIAGREYRNAREINEKKQWSYFTSFDFRTNDLVDVFLMDNEKRFEIEILDDEVPDMITFHQASLSYLKFLYETEQINLAITYLEQVIHLEPDDKFLLASLLHMKGKADFITKNNEKFELSVEAIKELQKAESILRELVEAYPDSAINNYLLSEVMITLLKYEAVLRIKMPEQNTVFNNTTEKEYISAARAYRRNAVSLKPHIDERAVFNHFFEILHRVEL